MRIALLTETFSPGMGYLENILPKHFTRLGLETHVVATDLPSWYREPAVNDAYKGFAKELHAGSTQNIEGFTLHVLGHKKVLGHMRMAGLAKKLRAIRPDIVEVGSPIGWIPLDAAALRASLGYKLFTGAHYHSSVFPLANQQGPVWSAESLKCVATRTVPGWLTSLATEKCYAISRDCADVATRFFGVPRRKLEVCPLGVDTEIFRPAASARDATERAAMREKLGFVESEIVCIYSGRLSEDKNPLLLARAVRELRHAGQAYRGLFVGNGAQAEEIEGCHGCVIHPFVPVQELGAVYRATEVGVWPTQESMSMLDAAACGLPIVANGTITARERLDGNGLTYRLNDEADLVRALLALQSAGTRRTLGQRGARKMAGEFSWESVARRRLRDYETALRSNSEPARKRARQGSCWLS